MQKTERNGGIDLLKVLLAIMVITIHINANGTGQVLLHVTESPWRQIVAIMTVLCYPAVNTYILITGYYSYTAHKNSHSVIKSLSLLWLSAMFFSIVGYFVSIVGFNAQFQMLELLKRFFPVIRGVWWFYTVYFALMLISPFLNKMIDSMLVGEHKLLLFILILLLSVFPVFVDWKGQLGSNYGYSLIWFIALYLVGAYLKRAKALQFKNKFVLNGVIGYIVSSFIMLLWPKLFGLLEIESTVSMYNSVFCLAQAICLFVFFGNIRLPKIIEKYVMYISSVMLSSYLLHCQEDIEKILWSTVHPSNYANSSRIIFATINIIIGVLIVSAILEILREKVCKALRIDKKFVKLTDSIFCCIERLLQIERSKK